MNYDLSVEQAGEAAGFKVRTAIDQWVNNGRWDWPSRGIRLLKLHGSIDWAWENDPSEDGRLPSRCIRQISTDAVDECAPGLVFGLRDKLRAEGPFLSALAEFELQMERASRLIVAGYSFRDDHVNQVIRRWTFEDRGREIVLIDPHLPARRPRKAPNMPFRESLLAHLNGDAPTKTTLHLIREPASLGFRKLFA